MHPRHCLQGDPAPRDGQGQARIVPSGSVPPILHSFSIEFFLSVPEPQQHRHAPPGPASACACRTLAAAAASQMPATLQVSGFDHCLAHAVSQTCPTPCHPALLPKLGAQEEQGRHSISPCRCQADVPDSQPPAAPAAQPRAAPALSRRAALAGLAAAPVAAAAVGVDAVVPGPAAAAAPAAAADALTVEQLFPGASQGALDTKGELRFTHRVFLGAFCSGRQSLVAPVQRGGEGCVIHHSSPLREESSLPLGR